MNGSYHKGNTWRLAEIVKCNLAKLDQDVKFEEIHLSELQLPFCIGCSNCFRIGYEKCPHYEKILSVIKSIENADGIILTSSTYNMRETALLKNLLDHLCVMLHRPHFFTSKALVITTTGGVGGKASAKSIASTLRGVGFNRCYRFSAATFSWNNYIPNEKTINKLARKTNKFYKDVKSKKMHIQSTSVLVPYNIFRGMSLNYTKESEYETEDGNYWTIEERKNRIYDKRIPVFFLQIVVGKLFYIIGKNAGKIKSMQVTYKK